MTKYNLAAARRPSPRKQEVHPVWRGIGCLLILIVPLLSYILADATVKVAVAQNWPMPYELMGYPVMPDFLWNTAVGLNPVLAFIQEQNNLYAILGITIFYIVVLGALISLAYSITYRMIGPSRYGPLDAPPPSVSVKHYKR